MQAAFKTLLALAVVCAVGVVAYAEDKKDDKKEVEYKGEIGCAKCTFKLSKDVHGGKCTNAIRVKEKKDGKDVTTIIVFIDNGKAEDYHQCTGLKKGSVKGVVSKKKETKDQLYITPAKDSVKID